MLPDTDGILGVRITSTTDVRLNSYGLWVATITIKQQKSADLLDWKEKEVKYSIANKDKTKALAEALLAIDAYMQPINYDLFLAPEMEKGELQ